MLTSIRFVLIGLLLLLLHVESTAQEKDSGPSQTDVKFLESLLRELLVDPKGAEFVKVTPKSPAAGRDELRGGWLLREKTGDTIRFVDGDVIPAPPAKEITKGDFVAEARAFYAKKPRKGFGAAHLAVDPLLGPNAGLVNAAWLYRLGEKELAAQVLARISVDREAEVAALRRRLAKIAFEQMVGHFKVSDDERALEYGERLFRKYAVEAQEEPWATKLVSDLQRRKQERALRKMPEERLPKEFATWERKKQVQFLIGVLDQIAVEHDYFGAAWASDVHWSALVEIGEQAAPALLDALDNDNRLTRSFFPTDRRFEKHRWDIVSVREVAWNILKCILRVGQFDTRVLTDRPADDEAALRKAAKEARAYWKEFGPLPFDERMMKVLNDPRSHARALREVAANLALPHRWVHGRPDWGAPDPALPASQAAVKKFLNPTAAAAILSAIDRDLADRDYLSHYLDCLEGLGDKRILGDLSQRANNTFDPKHRLQYAITCNRLGDSAPVKRFAADFEAKKVPVAKKHELAFIVGALADISFAEIDRALAAISNPQHPGHDFVVADILAAGRTSRDYTSRLFAHPYCLPMMRKLLDDKTETGIIFSIRQGDVMQVDGQRESWDTLPELLKEPAKRRTSAKERACDRAACAVARLVAGLPDYHVLAGDSDERLRWTMAMLDRFEGRFRCLSPTERDWLTSDFRQDFLLAPDIPPLGRPATADDVKAGKAIFDLDGKGKAADLDLPARGTFKQADKKKIPRYCLIVQAEVRPGGEVVYGIIERHAMRKAAASEFDEVKAVKKLVAK